MARSLVDTLQPRIDAAFRVAARKVIERARQAGHGIVTCRDGRVVEISCDDLEPPPQQVERLETPKQNLNRKAMR